MSDQSYYVVLNVMDRVAEHALKKFGSYSRFSKALGYSAPYFYKTLRDGSGFYFNTFLNAAKVLDLDPGYLLTGKNEKCFTDDHLSIEHILRLKVPYKPSTYLSIKSKIKHGKTKTVTLKTLFDFEEVSGISVIKILKGEF